MSERTRGSSAARKKQKVDRDTLSQGSETKDKPDIPFRREIDKRHDNGQDVSLARRGRDREDRAHTTGKDQGGEMDRVRLEV